MSSQSNWWNLKRLWIWFLDCWSCLLRWKLFDHKCGKRNCFCFWFHLPVCKHYFCCFRSFKGLFLCYAHRYRFNSHLSRSLLQWQRRFILRFKQSLFADNQDFRLLLKQIYSWYQWLVSSKQHWMLAVLELRKDSLLWLSHWRSF